MDPAGVATMRCSPRRRAGHFESYHGAPSDGSAWTRGGNCDKRVLRGGLRVSVPAILRSADRYGDNAGKRLIHDGFRVARTLD